MTLFNRFVHKSTNLHPIIKFFICYRYLFFVLFAAGIWVDATVYNERSLIGIYSLAMVFLGLVFSNVIQGIFNSLLVTLCRYSFSPGGFPIEQLEIGIFQWLSYFAIWMAVSSLVKKYIEQKENLIRVTTAFAKALDSRDKYTAFHSSNVSRYSLKIAKEMGFSENFCNDLKLGALLHDIGKIGIPESILNKPSRLTKDEYDVIKTHPTIGYEMVKDLSFFEKNSVLDSILYHHEREDGSGYPEGLKKDEIPMVAKIIGVADSFDAMTSNRVYRNENSVEYAVNEIVKNKQKHYDSKVVDAFVRIIDREGINILD
ncbi:HD-GYP domain-containing protein [Litchfieldia alkalitelluris]|uniref:HD-GYP domain-containing protein n=1 Tax=Litchfieldia alkalitelluris TaxID=304268 RepID=UPI001475C88F|nr:HD-GYP domain-containing protein [Litchfieldia alkalitelluris]